MVQCLNIRAQYLKISCYCDRHIGVCKTVSLFVKVVAAVNKLLEDQVTKTHIIILCFLFEEGSLINCPSVRIYEQDYY